MDKIMRRTVFFQETANGHRWIDVELNWDDEYDVVFKTQGFAPDGGLYTDVGSDVIGFGFETIEEAEEYAVSMAEEYGF